jgi:glycosyltransferase involved in cell wall biosynthesis
MNVLFITSSPVEANTSAMISNIALMKGFESLGHEVTILTFKPYDFMPVKQDLELDDIEVIKLDNNRTYSSLVSHEKENYGHFTIIKKKLVNIIRSLFHTFSLYDNYKSAVNKVDEFLPNKYYDLVISCSDPKSSHLLAKRFIENNRESVGKWIQHWGDPMYIDITRKSKLPSFLIKMEERNVLSEADKVIYVSPLTLESQKKIYSDLKDKFKFIPLAYLEEKRYQLSSSENETYPTLGYFGSYNSKIRNISPLYEAVKDSEFFLKVVGDSDITLESYPGKIECYPRVTFKQIEQFEEESDILVCICNKKGTQIPGKLYYYAATNKPILIIMDGESAKLKQYLHQYNRFEFCENNTKDIKKAINKIVRESKNKTYQPQPDFSPIEIAKKIIDCTK